MALNLVMLHQRMVTARNLAHLELGHVAVLEKEVGSDKSVKFCFLLVVITGVYVKLVIREEGGKKL